MSSEPVTFISPALLSNLHGVACQIGRTPMHEIKNLFVKKGVRVFAKKEWEQLSGSVKARAAFSIIFNAVHSGVLSPGKILLDATSGNTGIAYAAIAQKLGLPVALCLPENASKERKSILTALGATIIYTSRFEGTDGAQVIAQALASERPDLYFYADQYKNDQNWRAHYHNTAPEILESVPDITHFVAGLGTTGTFTGTGRRLRAHSEYIQLVALQPDTPMHGLEGWKHLDTAVVPGIYDYGLADRFLEIDTAEAYDMMKAAKRFEGLSLSPSSAANLLGAIKLAEKLEYGNIVTVLPDNADKYSEITQKLF